MLEDVSCQFFKEDLKLLKERGIEIVTVLYGDTDEHLTHTL